MVDPPVGTAAASASPSPTSKKTFVSLLKEAATPPLQIHLSLLTHKGELALKLPQSLVDSS